MTRRFHAHIAQRKAHVLPVAIMLAFGLPILVSFGALLVHQLPTPAEAAQLCLPFLPLFWLMIAVNLPFISWVTVSDRGLSKTVLPLTWRWRWEDIKTLDVGACYQASSQGTEGFHLTIIRHRDPYVCRTLIRERWSPIMLRNGDPQPERLRWTQGEAPHRIRAAIPLPRYAMSREFGEAIIAAAEAHGVEVTDKARDRLLHPDEYGDFDRRRQSAMTMATGAGWRTSKSARSDAPRPPFGCPALTLRAQRAPPRRPTPPAFNSPTPPTDVDLNQTTSRQTSPATDILPVTTGHKKATGAVRIVLSRRDTY